MHRNHHIDRFPADKMLPKHPTRFAGLKWSHKLYSPEAKKACKHLHNRKSRRWLKREVFRVVNSIG